MLLVIKISNSIEKIFEEIKEEYDSKFFMYVIHNRLWPDSEERNRRHVTLTSLDLILMSKEDRKILEKYLPRYLGFINSFEHFDYKTFKNEVVPILESYDYQSSKSKEFKEMLSGDLETFKKTTQHFLRDKEEFVNFVKEKFHDGVPYFRIDTTCAKFKKS